MIRRLIAQIFQPSFMPFMGVGGVENGYEIEKSIRLRSDSNANLSRAFPVAGNRKTWTYSLWVKRGRLGAEQYVFGAAGNINQGIRFQPNDTLMMPEFFTTTAVFRDPSAWYHIVVAQDTTHATASERMKLFINGERITSFSFWSPPSLNVDYNINAAVNHFFGRWPGGSGYTFDGYLSELNFIDGQALGPEEFGRVDQATGQWVAKPYTGTYGANGFYLDFKDGTDLTTLGQDKSGNGNNWTLNNVSLTSGAAYDWMDDTPSNNFPVLNPLSGIGAASNGNLRSTITNGDGLRISTVALPTSGKWYFEYVNSTNNPGGCGVSTVHNPTAVNQANTLIYYSSGQKYFNGTGAAYGVPYGINDIVGVLFDADNVQLSFTKNGVDQGMAYSNFSMALEWFFYIQFGSTSANDVTVNFGQRPFAYSPPTGFKALCTKNLKDDTVAVSGSFTGNANANGPFVWCNGTPETLTINGNAVTWGTHADRLANGFKLRTNSASYNASGTNNWTATILSPSRKSSFRNQRAKVN